MSKDYSEKEIQELAKSLIGHTFGEINNFKENSSSYNKGSFGHIIEKDVYNYAINSNPEPDFENVGIELKVTPYKINKNKTISAKERLVLNIINFMDEYKHEFYDSHFYHKNKKIQILWYLNEQGKNKKDFKITHQKLFTIPEEDLPIIINDYYTIINKIKDGKAHEISEADTMYLGACTKGENSNSLREQPFSDIKAKQRAFCFKTSYMTQLDRKILGNYEEIEKLLKDYNVSFDEYIKEVTDKYIGKSIEDLCELFDIDTKAKNLNSLIISRMFGIKGKLNKVDEFLKANIEPRTCRVTLTNRIKESVSFPAFKFIDVANTPFDKSDLKEELSTKKYMFFVFKEVKKDYYIFKGYKLFNVPEPIIENDFREIYEKTQDVIKSGNIIKEIVNGVRYTNFPGMSENKYGHVRPHGKDSKDTYPLPVPEATTGENTYTKQCFWLNNSYLLELVKDLLN